MFGFYVGWREVEVYELDLLTNGTLWEKFYNRKVVLVFAVFCIG